jgi:flagellar biosynthesis protein FliR
MNFHLEQLLAAAVFIGARISGLMVFCPFLASDAIPSQVKAALTVMITALVYGLHGPLQISVSAWQWAGVGLSEIVIGVVLGLTANFMLEGALMAGQVLGMQMGYSLASLFDPNTQAETPVLGTFHQLAAILIFLQLDVHHWLLRAVVRSFTYLPPGEELSAAATAALLRGAGGIFLAGLQIAAPALVATLMADVTLGFLGKASPQMPVLFMGISIKNLLGLVMMIASIAYWPHSLGEGFSKAVGLGEQLLHVSK